MKLPALLVASLLPEQGNSGVQTHFRAVLRMASEKQYETSLAVPYQVNAWLQRISGLITRVTRHIDAELAVLCNRFFLGLFLSMRLRCHMNSLDGRATVIYAQDPLSAKVALSLKRAGYQFRLVAVFHFNISEAYEFQLNGLAREGGRLWDELMHTERQILPELDQLIFVSNYMSRVVLSRHPGIDVPPCKIIPNFSDDVTAPKLNGAELGDLISIGTLEARKNQGYLIHIIAEAKRLGYHYRLTIVGDGPKRKEWEAVAGRLNVSELVSFIGYQADAANLLSSHRAYVHAARMENLPISLLEAMSCGLPVFAPPTGGIPEIFTHGAEGFLWPLDDATACAHALISTLENQANWTEMSRKARERYVTNFSRDVLSSEWLTTIFGNAETGSPLSASPSLSQRRVGQPKNTVTERAE
jgi:glycosyltransferase involved in cell wall biosynthesis